MVDAHPASEPKTPVGIVAPDERIGGLRGVVQAPEVPARDGRFLFQSVMVFKQDLPIPLEALTSRTIADAAPTLD